jgi:hypothetical protein
MPLSLVQASTYLIHLFRKSTTFNHEYGRTYSVHSTLCSRVSSSVGLGLIQTFHGIYYRGGTEGQQDVLYN